VILIVPKEDGFDGRILELCAEFATSHPESLNPDDKLFVATLDSNACEYFEERAGIAEFEVGMSRPEAEQFALKLTRAHFNFQK